MAAASRTGSRAAFVVVAVLAAAAAYEAAVALRLIELGSLPGEGPPGGAAVLFLALLTLVVGSALALVLAASAGPVRTAIRLLAPSAVAFTAARLYSFDPYYLPTLRRMSDGGVVAPEWVGALAVAAAAVAVLMPRTPRPALVATSVLLLLAFGTAVLAGTGH